MKFRNERRFLAVSSVTIRMRLPESLLTIWKLSKTRWPGTIPQHRRKNGLGTLFSGWKAQTWRDCSGPAFWAAVKKSDVTWISTSGKKGDGLLHPKRKRRYSVFSISKNMFNQLKKGGYYERLPRFELIVTLLWSDCVVALRWVPQAAPRCLRFL